MCCHPATNPDPHRPRGWRPSSPPRPPTCGLRHPRAALGTARQGGQRMPPRHPPPTSRLPPPATRFLHQCPCTWIWPTFHLHLQAQELRAEVTAQATQVRHVPSPRYLRAWHDLPRPACMSPPCKPFPLACCLLEDEWETVPLILPTLALCAAAGRPSRCPPFPKLHSPPLPCPHSLPPRPPRPRRWTQACRPG
jgi:hypothetical protein